MFLKDKRLLMVIEVLKRLEIDVKENELLTSVSILLNLIEQVNIFKYDFNLCLYVTVTVCIQFFVSCIGSTLKQFNKKLVKQYYF